MALIVLLLIAFSCGVDDTMPPPEVTLPNISIEDLSVDEGDADGFLFIRLNLDTPSSDLVTARISSMDDTALEGEDYVSIVNVPIIFEPGDLVVEYRMDIKGDNEPEPDETFTVEIVEVEGAEISKGTATITLINDEGSTGDLVIPSTGYSTPMSYPGMDLIWQDEFSGEAIDPNFWTFEIGTGVWGWGNNELQYYRKENAQIVEDHLVITAKKESFNGSSYTSTRMITKDKFDFKYGRVDIRAALPFGQGMWPALWMLGSNFSSVGWPACGEIDIMELIGHQPNRVYGTAHWSATNGDHASYGGNTALSSGIFNDEFHVFSIIWNETGIRWLLDDVEYHVINTTPSDLSEFHNNFFFIFNVAVGGNWPGSPNSSTEFPQHMIVDYVRVFQ